MGTLRDQKLLKEQEINEIFSNLTMLLDFHKELVKQISDVVDNWSESVTLGDIFVGLVSLLFTDFRPPFLRHILSTVLITTMLPQKSKTSPTRR